MGYFKKLKERRKQRDAHAVLELVTLHSKGTRMSVTNGVLDAINIFDQKKYEYENNIRENLEQVLNDPYLSDKLVEEIADVINEKSKVYGYRIAKVKRTELAQDILVALSVKK